MNLAIARIYRAQKKWADAVKQYKPLVKVPVLREDVLIEYADALKENQEKDKAIVHLDGGYNAMGSPGRMLDQVKA